MTKNITTLKRKSRAFVDDIHLDGLHWGAINSFDTSYDLREMEHSGSSLKSQVGQLSAGGRTALYDSIDYSIERLCKRHYAADRHGIPMMMLTFTDGKDNESTASIRDVRSTIDRYDFFPSNNCYFVIAGIGDASNSEMRELCADGYGAYLHADDIEAVFEMYKRIVTKLGKQVGRKISVTERPNETKVRLKKFKRRYGAIFPIDYALNLDCSGSMG
ncbi:vWA domain-containing protein [Haloarcula sp. AONF1]